MLRWAIVVTSDKVKANPELDQITPMARELIAARGHDIVYTAIAGNDKVEILHAIAEALARGADVVLVTGGTGPNPRDVSADIVYSLCERALPGIGEEFRRRSIEKGVVNAMLSRAGACGFAGRVLAVSPGNPDAARLMLELLFEIAGHVVEQLRGAKHS
ncbi:MogA/MoaB family molybdenum cofactor biosynthesis protein [Hyperthermus butylicus]|uniref:Molybdenum cofactor biosynthesis bifunctional protein n=1 Tax=Hyperthermus butylicus (strain DSM 5456 / JCM 9403 / PLM1-5) TaxID=415426 RepID=A2BK52_HYPBU|nr:molybdenum cofactor synthesis domain-containing protein [Hyperthermus butylicus]ABM80363.1 Molybdenum cofactor biosynthesis bifunctional protein [Hyperthermus butylicus DSM 5456]